MMLKDIKTIRVAGASFDSLNLFDFFDPVDNNAIKSVKGALLYGRNGTGKSTIARAFRQLAGESIPGIKDASFCDNDGKEVILDDDDKKHIFIFDEDYVDKNVRLKQDHLDTIVMLGPALNLAEMIEKAQAEQDKAKKDYEQQDMIYKEYLNKNNVKSPKYYLNNMLDALKGDDNWAGRDRIIKGNRLNTSVKYETYKDFRMLKPSKSKTELIYEYNSKLKELYAARNGDSLIDATVPSVSASYRTYDDEAIQRLLKEKIEKPELTDREKKLFSLLHDGKINALSQSLTVFRKSETIECPYCFQEVTKAYKESLVTSIEKVLSKDVEDHQKALQDFILVPMSIDLSLFEKLEGYQECVDMIAKINDDIQENNNNLSKKIENPYEVININVSTVKNMILQLITALEALERNRVEYNKKVKQTDNIIQELIQINAEIAHYDITDIADQYDKQNREFFEVEKKNKKLKEIYDEKLETVADLEAKRSDIKLALDAINSCMKYIFFADDRLKIEYKDGAYKLISRGKSVKPCDVSVGERNIIGLSYFFTSILDGQEEKDAYNKEYLLVIDDPISSFDIENRIGIMSFLKYKLSLFLEGNQNTKALVMTHDLRTFYDIHKIFEEIIDACKQNNYPHGVKFNRFEIRDGRLYPFSYKKRQEYTEIIKIIYKYANGKADDYELVIGNMMRQALEAFSTFEYKKGIEDVSTNTQILNLLGEPEYVSYYKNLMYRLILHGGSHKEEQIKTMNDFQFFSLISDTEKKKTAKDILCFIYLLNKRHLLEHLEGGEKIESELDSWCQDIKKSAAVI